MPYAPSPSTSPIDNDDDQPPSASDIEVRASPGLTRACDANWIATQLRRAAEFISRHEDKSVARVNVLIVDDARMIHLHERHSGDASTTDVLTFDLREDPAGPVEADIIVCADEAARRAAEFKHSIERELLLYCVHGLLHCLGHDDHDDAGWRRMHAREDEVLTAIGVGATFNAHSEDAGEGRS